LYVRYANNNEGDNLQYEINDVKIRDKDRMQYVTGTYLKNTGIGSNPG